MIGRLFRGYWDERTTCTVDLAITAEEMYAHVTLDGAPVRPGDEVTVLDAPGEAAFGMVSSTRHRARLRRAGPLKRLSTRIAGYFAIASLLEVGTPPRRKA